MTLRVTLEIIPFGKEENKRVIEVVNISNWQQTDLDIYSYRIEDNRYKEFREDDQWVDHNRSDGALTLVCRALAKLDFFRKNHP